MESSIYDQTKDVSDNIDQASVTPDSQTTDNSSSKFSESLSMQVDLTFLKRPPHSKFERQTLFTKNGRAYVDDRY